MVGGASETLPQVRLGTQPPRVSSVACGFSPGVSQPRPTSKVGRGRVRPTCSSPSHDPALLQDGKASSAAGGGRPNREPPPIPSRTLGLLAKVQRELSSASVSPERERWHPELGGPWHPNQSRAAAACAGPVVGEEAPGLGQQPGVVAPGGGWHRSGAPAGAGEEQEGRVRIRGGCWLCCRSEPCRERALRPGVRSPTVAQGYCDPPLRPQASVKTLESLSFPRPGRPPSIGSLPGTCCSAGDSMWDPHVVN